MVPRLRAAAEAATELGAHVRFLQRDELRERGVPPAVCCGVLEERGGHLDPGRYVLGLRTAALAAGVRLFEGTRVIEILDESPARVRCARGSVLANYVILATNAYTPRLGWKKRSVAPLRVSLFETQPLREEELASLDWPGREGLYTSHEILESYRLTDRTTIVGGSKSVRYRFGSRLENVRT